MEERKIKLAALWVVLMLTYLLGDVLRIFSGDFEAGEIGGMQITQVAEEKPLLKLLDQDRRPPGYELGCTTLPPFP